MTNSLYRRYKASIGTTLPLRYFIGLYIINHHTKLRVLRITSTQAN
jgi:hypothetical protein